MLRHVPGWYNASPNYILKLLWAICEIKITDLYGLGMRGNDIIMLQLSTMSLFHYTLTYFILHMLIIITTFIVDLYYGAN